MTHEKDIALALKVFSKSNLGAAFVSQDKIASEIISHRPVKLTDHYAKKLSLTLPKVIKPKTMYMINGGLELRYIFMMLSEDEKESVLLLGPYLNKQISDEEIEKMRSEFGVPGDMSKYFREYYLSIPVLKDGNPVLLIIDSLCEEMWETSSYAIVKCREVQEPLSIDEREQAGEGHLNDVLVNIQAIEKRYSFENDMINAVAKGQLQLEKIILSMFSANMFEKRSNDTLRNAKNYCIILNTLLRKAAENGGVHPIHIDKISGEFALKIESMNDFEQVGPNMVEMFRTYCRLVRKHSVMKYSSAVRKAILVIESDISSEISVSELAKSQGLSLGYFSTLFKKETGKSVSDFIREKRMKRASHLLRTTDLQIQTVAEKCGILDLRYFSKLFKREYGVPPKQYREQNTVIQKNIEE
jgi:YesN/AraC family two-component response regulator